MGICEPAPEREQKTTWREFLEQHWDLIVAADFFSVFTVEAWTRRRLQRFIVLFFIELSTPKVQIAGIAPPANGLWMNQIARNVTDSVDGILKGKRRRSARLLRFHWASLCTVSCTVYHCWTSQRIWE
jgi:hypothetical protein